MPYRNSPHHQAVYHTGAHIVAKPQGINSESDSGESDLYREMLVATASFSDDRQVCYTISDIANRLSHKVDEGKIHPILARLSKKGVIEICSTESGNNQFGYRVSRRSINTVKKMATIVKNHGSVVDYYMNQVTNSHDE